MRDKGTPFIHTENLWFSYNGDEDTERIPIIRGISIDIEKGSFVAILGHNGSGKSTFAKLLNMILTPDSGKICIDGKDITDGEHSEEEFMELRRNIGMVFQNPDNQLVATIVEEDVAFGPENMGIPPAEIRERVDNALKTVAMTEFARHSPHQLSGGQKQRVAIAGVIAMMPKCIIFDEATAMLDPAGRSEVMRTIRTLNKDQGITVIHITHNMNEAIEADRVIVINDGTVFLDDKPAKVFSNVEELQRIGLDVPQVTELIFELKKCGFESHRHPLPNEIIFEGDGAKAIADILAENQV